LITGWPDYWLAIIFAGCHWLFMLPSLHIEGRQISRHYWLSAGQLRHYYWLRFIFSLVFAIFIFSYVSSIRR
jgi:hypothetical protein